MSNPNRTGNMKRTKGRCPLCGHTGPVDHDHVARAANDREFIIDICPPDHKLKTKRDETSGNTPGIDQSGARLIGTLQHLLIQAQRHGVDETSALYRNQSHDTSRLHGREGVTWARPNRVADVAADADVLVLIRDTARITASLWARFLTDQRLTVRGQMLVSATVDFYNLVAEYPLEFTRYASTANHDSLADTSLEYTQHNYPKGFKKSYFTSVTFDRLEKTFSREAADFARHIGNRDCRVAVVPCADNAGSSYVRSESFKARVKVVSHV